MNQVELLDAAKAVTGSDYKTAKSVGVSKQRISNARLRGTVLDDEINGQIGELLGKAPWETICEVRLAHADTHENRKIWRRWAGAAVLVIGVGTISVIAAPSMSYAGATGMPFYTLCIFIGFNPLDRCMPHNSAIQRRMAAS